MANNPCAAKRHLLHSQHYVPPNHVLARSSASGEVPDKHALESLGYPCVPAGIRSSRGLPGAADERRYLSVTIRITTFSDLKGPGRTPGPFSLPRNGNRHRPVDRWGWPLPFHTLNTQVGNDDDTSCVLLRTHGRVCARLRAKWEWRRWTAAPCAGVRTGMVESVTRRALNAKIPGSRPGPCAQRCATRWRGRVAKARGCRPRNIGGASPSASSMPR